LLAEGYYLTYEQ